MKIERSIGWRIAGVVVLIALINGGLAWRASWIAHYLLQSWIAATVRETSGGVYDVAVGSVRLNFALRRVSVDTIQVRTNGFMNSRRPNELATLSLTFHDCRVTGVHIITLMRSNGLVADAFGCRAVDARFVVPPGVPDTDLVRETRVATRDVQQRIHLPSFAPRLQLGRIDFPRVALDLRVRHAKGGDSNVRLKRFRWHMTDFVIDTSDASNASRPLFSRSTDFYGDSLAIHPDSNTVIRLTSLSGSVTDSTLDGGGLTVNPVLSRIAFAAAQSYRRKYSTLRVARISARGVNVGALLLGNGLRARSATFDSLRLDVTNDQRLPVKPGPGAQRRTPQQWVADIDRPVQIDSVILKNSRVTYRLRKPERDDFGIVTFARLNALALNMNTSTADTAARQPMRLAVSSWLQDSALLSMYAAVPLRARRFDMTFRGTLGPMQADHLNQLVEATTPIRIVRGDVASIEFGVTVSDGLALGTITPLYNGFTIAVNREGSKGLAGRSGFVGSFVRTVGAFSANMQKINSENPVDPRNKPRVGKIHHPFSTNEALPDFIWYGIRDGLIAVISR